ncbi:MAG: InlB B-repeat-containing protein [Paludibacteraceae bacterium]|nr:InlB B-repeat-containing protein [Paludibacteraceae bacterium]
MWGETIVLSEVNSSDKWYEVEGVGRVTNKSGSAFSNSDSPCESQTSYKTGSNYFSVQTYTAISSLTVHAVSTSNRTLSGVAIGSSVASSAPSSIDENVSSPTSGTQVVAKNTCDNTFTLSFKQAVDANQYICIKFSGNVEIVSVTFTPSAPAGGADPVDPTFTYTPTTYTIGDPALDLSTKLTSNSGGAISFAVSTADAGTTGASIANGKDFTATTAGTATITVTQAETTGYNAKTQDIAVSVVEPDPCTTYYHFVATSDATANSKTNWSGFTNAPTGSNGQDNSVTIDGTTYTLKKRTGSTGKESTILGFTIPAGKVGTLYGYMKSSGSAGRTLSLKKGDEVVATNTEIVDGNWTLITIGAITSGTYTLVPNENVQIQMFALKVCDAVFHTVTFNSNGGSSVVEQSVLDGTTAIQPTDPERGKYTFLGWYNGETLYDWATPVASDLTLTAKWQNPWSITFDSDGGSEVETITVKHNTKAEKPSDPTKVNYNFEGWFYGEPATPFDWNANITQDYTLKAQWIDDNNVARIGDTYYTNLDEAVAYANENADAEIVLLKDIDRADRITLTKSTTINLNGNKLSKTDGGWLIFVKEGATLTINGETENSAIHGGISLGAMTNNNGSLVINGGTYTCADGVACVHVNGTCLESNVTIIGASLTSPTDIAIQLNGKGTYTITNATITGATGVYIKSGELTVTNSTIKGTKTPADYAYTGNGANATGDAIVVDACDYPGGAPTLNIISGTFEGTKGAVGNYNYNGTSAPAIGGIQGGTFNTEVPADLCADGYIPVKNGENNYGVTKTAKTFSLEDLVTTQGTGADYEEYLNNLGWSVANANALDNLNTEKDYDNYPYLGLKFKSAAGYVEGVVEGDKLLTIQLGHMAADADLYENGTKKVSLSGKDAETAAVHYYYVENQSTIKLQMTNDGTCVLKAVTITDPFSVTFNTNGGDDIAAVQGKPSITLPEPTNGTMNFKGWYDAETGGNLIGVAGASYTPTGNITLHAQWEAQSTINTLSDLKVNGETVLGFAANEHTYRMVLPYKSALPKITSATPTNANAKVALWPVDGPEWTDEYDGGCYRQQVVVTPQDPTAEKGYYDIRITYTPKDGVSIIKVATTGGTNKTVTGLYAGEGDVNLSGSKKMDGGKYIGFTLDGTTLQAGDRINVHTTDASTTGGSHIIFYDNMTDKTELYDTGEIGGKGDNIFTINAAMVGQASAYVYRSDADAVHKWNGYIDYIEVTRPMNPVLTAITFDGVPGVIDEAHKKVTVELPFSSDVASLEVEPTIAWNAPATTNSIVVDDGNWVVGDNTYVLTDKDGDQTTYTITLTKAAASADATLKTLTINGNALTLVDGVYEYDYELPYGTTTDPTVVAEANDANATAVVTSVSLTEAVITVTAENGTTQQKYTINFTISPWQNIVIWDGSTMDAVAASPDASGLTWEVNGFKSIAEYTTTCGSKTYSKVLPSGGSASDSRNFKIVIPDGYLAKFYIAFASHEEGTSRGMSIGTTINKNSDTSIYGAECSTRSEALGGTSVIVGAGTYYINPRASIDFCEVSVLLRPGYIRTGLTVGSLGTICLPSNVPAGYAFGATFYELKGKEPQYGKIVFDEILSDELVAGKPYLFQAQSDVLYCFYGTESVSDPDNSGAMKGTFVNLTLTDLTNIYYFAQKALWSCVDLTSLSVPANRAYVDMDDMPAITESNPAPGVRRITLGVNGQQVATGVDQVQGDEVPTKMIINGQLFILRGEKMYDAQGKLVK